MPALIGKPAVEAVAILGRLGLTANLVDRNSRVIIATAGLKVAAQSIDGGRLAPMAEPIVLILE
jgi:hypothetical protein